MNELNNLDKLAEKTTTEVQVKKNQQVEFLYDGSIKPMPGHTMFEINTKTLEVAKAEYLVHKVIEWADAVNNYLHPEREKKEIVRKKDCVYVSALNAETALFRYRTGKGSAKLEMSNSINELR